MYLLALVSTLIENKKRFSKNYYGGLLHTMGLNCTGLLICGTIVLHNLMLELDLEPYARGQEGPYYEIGYK